METSLTLSFRIRYPNQVKGPQSQNVEEENKLAIVLDETCVNQQDYSTSLMGKVKEFCSLPNLKVVLANEDDKEESDTDDEIRDEELHDESAGMHNHATVEGESDVKEVYETIFENQQYQAYKKDDHNVGHNDIRSKDPFNIYDLLNKKQDKNIGGSSLDNMKYPPGFTHMVATENGEVVIMGDFNELRKQAERYGSTFNMQGADAFNSFILATGLEE
ncbi:hypothetical protein Tco_1450407, partial [Tanacetum coccineum]